MRYLLGYFLVGFALHFLGTSVFKYSSAVEWYWDLAGIVLWPLVIVLAIYNKIRTTIEAKI